ncbi:hypothetical protein EX895_006271 [Sporisorium graminicola]|uniref:Peptidase M41 FtsH extracellular domain-containing protein n=1 Tax=Sporisorium graminicola TaxID=280036 RepID=A0A4U7KLT7_9BASI|nr:hypothetical protein EX895_006271 [Sporisorium graminicola]TKY85191.1 hypothetical protein EX895_006271 [Sporisorium graminicola]
MLRSITSRSARGRFGLAACRSTQPLSSSLPSSSSAGYRSFTNITTSRSHLTSSSKLALPQHALGLQFRHYATPAEDGDKKNNSAKEHDEDEQKKKDFEQSVERGLNEARQGKADGSLPENLKQFFESDSKKPTSSKSNKESEADEDDVAERKKKKNDEKSSSGASSGGGPNGQFTEIRINANTILATIVSTYLLYRLTSPDQPSREITWQEFRTAFLDKGLVDRLVVVNRSKVKVYLHSNATGSMYPASGSGSSTPAGGSGHAAYWFSVGSVEAFERRLDEAQRELEIPANERIPVAYHEEISTASTLLHFAPTLLIAGLLFWMSRRAAGGAMGGGGGGGPGGIFG